MQPNEEGPRAASFVASVVAYEECPNECTISPANVDTHHRTTTWITAKEGSYCSLLSRR